VEYRELEGALGGGPLMPTRRDGSFSRTVAVLLALGVLGALVMASSAAAGTIAVVSCKTSAGAPAPTEGWEEGWTASPFPDAGDGDECASGGPLSAYVGDGEAQPGSSGPYWRYTPPPGLQVVGGEVTASFSVPGGGGGFTGAAGLLGPKLLFDAADVIGGPAGGVPGNYAATYSLAGHTGGSLWMYAFCEPPGDTCPRGDSNAPYWAAASIDSATIELNDASAPQASGFSGSLLTGTASGTAQLAFTASEAAPGPGIYTVTVSADGHALYSGTPDGDGGRCVTVGHDANGVAEFLYPDPCPLSEQLDLPIDTTGLADGNHDLQVTVTDAGGVSATVFDGTITTANRTTVSALLSSPPTSAAGTEPVYAIVLDKDTAALGSRVRRSFDSSALTLSGVLRNPSGVPAPGIPVSLLVQVGPTAGAAAVLTRTVSDGAGHWLLHAPRGPSRLLRIVSGNAAHSAATGVGVSLSETVSPSLGLRVRTPGAAELLFTGRLAISPLGSPPPLVIIETHTGDGWQAVGSPVRVAADGSYRYAYRSSPLTLGRRFAFRAQTPATSLWQTGSSPVRQAVVR